MYDIVSLGELLIDFTESGISAAGQRLFEQNPGGAVTNLLCAASQCGAKTGFIGTHVVLASFTCIFSDL